MVSRVTGLPDQAKPPPELWGAGGALGSVATGVPGLGSRGTEFPPPGAPTTSKPGLASENEAEARAEERRKDRWANRRLLWKMSGEKSVQCCGRGVLDQGAGVTIKTTADRAYVSGITRCGAIWLDPVCSAKIRAERSEEISAAVVKHLQAGGTAYMATLTVRHYKRHQLDALMDSLRDAFSALTSGAQWAGDPGRGREGERKRLGILGFIRSTEVTEGIRNGWHPHLHVILLMGARQNPRPKIPRKANRPEGWVKPEWDPRPTSYFPVPDPSWDRTGMSEEDRQTASDFERMQERWRRVWEAWTAKNGFRATQKRGVQFDRITTVQDAQALGEYLAKTQDGEKQVGMEVARGDLKTGRVKGNATPFELLTRYRLLRNLTAEEIENVGRVGLDVGAELARIERVWREYEKATKGRRAIESSRDLRTALELGEERTDEEIVDEEEHGEDAAHLTADGWGRVCRLQMDYRVLRALEVGGLAELTALLGEIGVPVETPAEHKRLERARYGRTVPAQGTGVPAPGR